MTPNIFAFVVRKRLHTRAFFMPSPGPRAPFSRLYPSKEEMGRATKSTKVAMSARMARVARISRVTRITRITRISRITRVSKITSP